jgi:hypothetical protein
MREILNSPVHARGKIVLEVVSPAPYAGLVRNMSTAIDADYRIL